jgi:hypothetical protein
MVERIQASETGIPTATGPCNGATGMNRRHAASLLLAFSLGIGLAFFVLTTHVRAEGSPTAIATAAPAVTPVTPLPPPDSPTQSDDVGNGVKYFVIGLVLGIFLIAAGVLGVLWFVID